MHNTLRSMLYSLPEIGIAGFLLYLDTRYFLFFAFIYYVFTSNYKNDYLRKVVRVTAVESTIRENAIMGKLDVGEADCEAAEQRIRSSWEPGLWESLQRDFEELQRYR